MTSTGLNLSGTEEAQGLGQGFPRATDDVNVSPQLQVTVRTVLGSLTGQTLRISASKDMTVQDFKLLAQSRDPVPPNERSNTAETIDGVSPDFKHLFFKDTKLENGLCSLGDAGVEEGSELTFGVESGLAGQLRGAAMEHLLNPPVDLSGVGDDKILMTVLNEYKIRAQRHDTQAGDLLDDLYDIFTSTGLSSVPNVKNVWLDYSNGLNVMHWLVEEQTEGACPYKVYNGIPVEVQLYRRNPQTGAIGELPNPTSLVGFNGDTGSQGYFASMQRMACCAHFSGPQGSKIYRNEADFTNNKNRIGKTIHQDNTGVDYGVVSIDLPVSQSAPVGSAPMRGQEIIRPATYQTGPLRATVLRRDRKKLLVQDEVVPGNSKSGDSNTPWLTPNGKHAVGIHSTGDPTDGKMSVIRLDNQLCTLQPVQRQSKRQVENLGGSPRKRLKF